MVTFVGLAHSREIEYQRIVMSMLSLYAWTENASDKISFILYTDNEKYFEPYFKGIQIIFVNLTPEVLADWKGKDNFMFRVKVKAIQDATIRTPNNDILFLDSDTFLYTDSEPLLAMYGQDKTILYAREYSFNEAVSKGGRNSSLFLPVIKNNKIRIKDLDFEFSGNNYSWNTGVIGFSHKNLNLIDFSLELTDYLYERVKVFVIEQYSFSLIFQTKTNIQASDKYVYHYYSRKKPVDEYVLKFVSEVIHVNDLNNKKTFVRKFTADLFEKIKTNPQWQDRPVLMDKIKLLIERKGDIRILKHVLSIIKNKILMRY
ncbi:hypothetical protein LRS06_04540 [Hymenobacter sp. J193]|uniref:hypothetical protein n=1 Tax=Hymenobacter sp. J193 TaxID=2898429 RepID=UPI00215099AD|nr:hypothetical protein [Hymenobacter sp. J193]MCR5887055.1 hypothetical protein [Hymenobacter sp. J193]